MKPKSHFILVVACAVAFLHCVDKAVSGAGNAHADPTNALLAPPVFTKLWEGTMGAAEKNVEYETDAVEVGAYREVAVRLLTPLASPNAISIVVPEFADSVDGTFLNAGIPVPTGGRVPVNGAFMRLRYTKLTDEAPRVPFAIYGVK